MSPDPPATQQYLSIISEWSSIGASGVRVGNAFPLFSLTKGTPVANPPDEFPNPGAIFLVNRGDRHVWDWVIITPKVNELYRNSKLRDCYYIGLGIPEIYEPDSDVRVASVIDVPHFNIQNPENIIRRPHQSVTPLFFIRDDYQRMYGPLLRTQVVLDSTERLEAIHWVPWGGESVYEFTQERLNLAGCKLVSYQHPDPPNEVVQRPIHFLTGPVSRVTSVRVHDRISDSQLAEWYFKSQGIAGVPDELLKTLKAAPEKIGADTPEQVQRRFRRLGQVYSTLETMQTERQALARQFLDSDEGQKLIDQRLSREVEQRAAQLEIEVQRARGDLVIEQQRLAEQLEQAKAGQAKEEVTRLQKKYEGQKQAVEQIEEVLRAGVDKLGQRLQDEIPLLAAMSGRAAQTVVVEGGAAANSAPVTAGRTAWSNVAIPAPSKDLAVRVEEPALVDQIADELRQDGLYFTREFVANLYVLLKSSSLNLLIGPPGYGKSSVVAALAKALGHGTAFLEIAVRRSWSDDRHLLGFYDAFHGRYDPGPTGLAPRLLQAQRDWDGDRRGIYMILMDEFNLSAPEYYFSQLLQVVTRPPEQSRIVRLFDADAVPFAAENVDQITIYPNVTFWGTINYDETTERLSPRLLDRTGMVFLTPRDVLPGERIATERKTPKGVRAAEVCGTWSRTAEQCPRDLWDQMEPLLELLATQSDEWGPQVELSPRVLTAIRRYLANSAGVLAAEKAVDFAFQQRVLPVLRGRGPQYTARVQALEKRLSTAGLERSARHVHEATTIAATQFGDIDFLAY
jgi:energy-coupling factor transporter ATP-binding protein EcfA2